MNYQEQLVLLNNYIYDIKQKQKALKEEITFYFEQNKEHENITFLIYQTFDDKIREFENSYNMSCLDIVTNSTLAQASFAKTIEIYLDLSQHPQRLLETLPKNKVETPPNLGE